MGRRAILAAALSLTLGAAGGGIAAPAPDAMRCMLISHGPKIRACDYATYRCTSGLAVAERDVRLLKYAVAGARIPEDLARLESLLAGAEQKLAQVKAAIAAHDAARVVPDESAGDDLVRQMLLAADLVVFAALPPSAGAHPEAVQLGPVLKGVLPAQADQLRGAIALSENSGAAVTGIYFLRASAQGYTVLPLAYGRFDSIPGIPAAPPSLWAGRFAGDSIGQIAMATAALFEVTPQQAGSGAQGLPTSNQPLAWRQETALRSRLHAAAKPVRVIPPDKAEYLYQNAADVFLGMKLTEAGAALHEAARQAGDVRAQVFIDAALVRLGDETQLRGLEAFVAQPVNGISLTSEAARAALDMVKSAGAEKLAILASHAANPAMQNAGIIALANIHTDAAIRRLGELLAGADAGVRAAAHRKLCELALVCLPCDQFGKPRPVPDGAALVRAVLLWRQQNKAVPRPY